MEIIPNNMALDDFVRLDLSECNEQPEVSHVFFIQLKIICSF
jgi:hypothetical protein